VVDLESTFMAVYGLYMAHKNGVLPARTSVPVHDRKALGRSFNSTAVLLLTANKLLQLEDKQGGWPEYKHSSSHKIFDALKIIKPAPLQLTESKGVNFESTLLAYATLECLSACSPQIKSRISTVLKREHTALNLQLDAGANPFSELIIRTL